MNRLQLLFLMALVCTIGHLGAMQKEQTYYQVLGLQPDATSAQIKRAYIELSKAKHPDKPGGSQAEFTAISSAYQALKEQRLKNLYDMFLRSGLSHRDAVEAVEIEEDRLSRQQQRETRMEEERSKREKEKDERLTRYINQAEDKSASEAEPFYRNYLREIRPFSIDSAKAIDQAGQIVMVYRKLITKYLDENNKDVADRIIVEAQAAIGQLQKEMDQITKFDKTQQKLFLQEVEKFEKAIGTEVDGKQAEEARRREELKRKQDEERRQEELRRQQEEAQRQEQQRREEELRRVGEEWRRKQEEVRQQEELRRQQEEARRQEEIKRQQQEAQRQETLRREEELRRAGQEWRRTQEEARKSNPLLTPLLDLTNALHFLQRELQSF